MFAVFSLLAFLSVQPLIATTYIVLSDTQNAETVYLWALVSLNCLYLTVIIWSKLQKSNIKDTVENTSHGYCFQPSPRVPNFQNKALQSLYEPRIFGRKSPHMNTIPHQQKLIQWIQKRITTILFLTQNFVPNLISILCALYQTSNLVRAQVPNQYRSCQMTCKQFLEIRLLILTVM